MKSTSSKADRARTLWAGAFIAVTRRALAETAVRCACCGAAIYIRPINARMMTINNTSPRPPLG
jgi:hypothetical protein